MGWYYVITQEIRETFEGKEADIYAVINGFSQEGQGCFYGSLSLLSRFCGIKSKTTTQKVLKSLVDKGAILKEDRIEKGVKTCIYYVNRGWKGMSKIDMGISKIDMGGISEIGTNNKENIDNINTSINKKQSKFQKPSLDEIRDYCRSRSNSVDPELFYNFYESKGWMVGKNPMKDWQAAIRTWEISEKGTPKKKGSSRKESVLEHNLKVMDELYGTNIHQQVYGKDE